MRTALITGCTAGIIYNCFFAVFTSNELFEIMGLFGIAINSVALALVLGANE